MVYQMCGSSYWKARNIVYVYETVQERICERVPKLILTFIGFIYQPVKVWTMVCTYRTVRRLVARVIS